MRAISAIIAVSVLIVGGLTPALAIDIDVIGGWSRTITAADLQAGAGSDLISTYESAADQASATIFNTAGNTDAWRVDVRRSDTNWHPNFVLSVRRTGDGTGGGVVSGGTVYQAITTTDAEFFSGTGDRSNIPIQFKLEGMSIQVPPSNYSTTVVYTVVDIP